MPSEPNNYQGAIGAVYGVATERFTWEWPFYLIAFAGVPVIWLAVRFYPAPRQTDGAVNIDLPGMVALAMGDTDFAGSPSLLIGLLVFGLAMTAVFAYIEIRSDTPLMPMEILADRATTRSAITALLTSFGLYESVCFLDPFAQIVPGASMTDSAAMFLPMLLGMGGGGILASQLLSRIGARYRLQAVGNTAVMLAGTVLTITIDANTNRSLIWLYVALTGFGFGGLVSTFSIAVQNTVPFSLVGAATSALQFDRSIGGMAGLAVLGGLLSRRFTARFDRTVTDQARAALPDDHFAVLRKDPVALVEPETAQALRSELAGNGADGAALADSLIESLHAAFVLAMGDIFTVVAVLTAVAVGVVLLFRVPAHTVTRTRTSASS